MFAGLRKLWNNRAIRIIVCNSARHKVQTRSCLHDKRLDLGTRQTWESSDLCNKSADFECLQDCGSCETTEQSVSLFAIQQGGNYYDTNFQKKQENHKTIFVTVFFMLHCFSSTFLHRIRQAHNKEKANGSKNNCGQTNIHFLLCDFSFWWRRIDIDLSSDGTCFVSVYSQKKSIYPKYLGWKIRLDD